MHGVLGRRQAPATAISACWWRSCFVSRNGEVPRLHREARIAASAQIIGNVQVGARCYMGVHRRTSMPFRTAAFACVLSLAALAQASSVARKTRQPSAADASTLLTLMQIYFSEP